MSASDTLGKIAEIFGMLGAGVPDPQLQRLLWQQLAEDFAQLQLDLDPLLATETGWSSPTGTGTLGSFNTGTVTLPQLAQNVKGIIDTMMDHGVVSP